MSREGSMTIGRGRQRARHHVVASSAPIRWSLPAARESAKPTSTSRYDVKTTHHLFQLLLHQVATGIISKARSRRRSVVRRKTEPRVRRGRSSAAGKTVVFALERVTTYPYDSINTSSAPGSRTGTTGSPSSHSAFGDHIDDASSRASHPRRVRTGRTVRRETRKNDRLLTRRRRCGATGRRDGGSGSSRWHARRSKAHLPPPTPTRGLILLGTAYPSSPPPYGGKLQPEGRRRNCQACVEVQSGAMVVDDH